MKYRKDLFIEYLPLNEKWGVIWMGKVIKIVQTKKQAEEYMFKIKMISGNVKKVG